MVKIKSIKRKKYNGKIYDITLQNEDDPYFYANSILSHNSLYPHIMMQCNIYGAKKDGVIDERPTWSGGGKWKVDGLYYTDEMHPVGKLIRKYYNRRLFCKRKFICVEDQREYKMKDVDKLIGKHYYYVKDHDPEMKLSEVEITQEVINNFKNLADSGIDRKEYSLKILMNILFGILDESYYINVYNKQAANDITSVARQWIMYARKIYKEFGMKVIYTDSVGKDSLINTNKGQYTVEHLFKKGNKISVDNEKEYSISNNYKVTTSDDNYNIIYDNVKKIIRHKTKKKIYKIYTHINNLIVTEDHSLICFDKDGNFIERKPKDAKYVLMGAKEGINIHKIQKIEEIKYNDYVYDIETTNTHRFFANDILVHNTDSCYVINPFEDDTKLNEATKKIITDIKATVPFPQATFDLGIDDAITNMFFFKGKGKNTKVNEVMDEDDFINKPKGFMKKNYIYITTDGKVKIKNLGIRKKSNSPLSRKIFHDYLIPQMVEKKDVKFSKTYLKNLITELLEKDITLACFRKSVKPVTAYANGNVFPAQVSAKYGPGIHFLIPNTANIGVGKGRTFCTLDEFKARGLTLDHIDYDLFWSELDYFIKPVVTKSIFDF